MGTLSSISLPLALAAGLVSFVSPCVLPLVPAYIGYLGGNAASADSSLSPVGGAVAFISGLGLYLIFFFYLFAAAIGPVKAWLLPVLGALVVLLGLQMIGAIHIPFLERSFSPSSPPQRKGAIPSFLLGLGFAAGWTPCIGLVLGAVLTSAASIGPTPAGLALMIAYCLGLGVPFLLFGIFLERLRPVLKWLNQHHQLITRVGGSMVICMGLLVITNHVTLLNSWLSAHLPQWMNNPLQL